MVHDGGMSLDRHSIFTQALQRIGEAEYVEKAATKDPCQVWYIPCLREACGLYNWTFTKRTARLQRVEHEGYRVLGKALFRYPAGWVKGVEFRTMEGARVTQPEMVAEGILAPLEECPEWMLVRYQDDGTMLEGAVEVAPNPEWLAGFVCLLASRIAMPVCGSGTLADALRQEAGWHFQVAIAIDRQQDSSNDIDPEQAMRKRGHLARMY